MLSSAAIAFLKRLLDAPGPSGFETLAGRSWRSEAQTFAEKVRVDVAGNCMAEVNPGGSPTILIDGHIDEIGVKLDGVPMTLAVAAGPTFCSALGAVASLHAASRRTAPPRNRAFFQAMSPPRARFASLVSFCAVIYFSRDS
jgi:hypothetical protein